MESLLTRHGLRFLLGPALRPGDIVQVKSRQQIMETLDASGACEGLPFMQEMESFCGKTFRVHRRIDKINDMRNKTGLRRMRNAVTLTEVRCTGAAHGGCQAECQILWKDGWLAKVPRERAAVAVDTNETPLDGLNDARQPRDRGTAYICQMTRLWEASEPMSRFDVRQDLRPLLEGNIALGAYLIAILTRIFNIAQRMRGGVAYPYLPPSPTAGTTPTSDRHFRPGDVVLVRTKEQIANTLVNGRNKGLWFDPEMIRFCRQPVVVRKRVERLIHEGTGMMVHMKTPCLMLSNVLATGEFLRLCPQHEYIFWREIWLTPADENMNISAASKERSSR